MHPRLRLVSVTLLCLSLCSGAAPAGASTIVDTLLPEETTFYGGAWFGTIYWGEEVFSFVLGQTFQPHRQYSQVQGAVSLAYSYYEPPVDPVIASFILAPDDFGQPGVPLAAVDVTLTTSRLATYALPFVGIELQDEAIYWLVATTTLFQTIPDSPNPNCDAVCTGIIPIWANGNSGEFGGQALKWNSGPWEFTNWSFGFAMYGTELGEPEPIPEPTSLFLLGTGGLGLLATMRRRRKQDLTSV